MTDANATKQTEPKRPRGKLPFSRGPRTMNLAALRDAAGNALDEDMVLLTPEKLAYTMQLYLKTVNSLLESGILPSITIPVKAGNIMQLERRVPAQALLDWISENTCTTVAASQSGSR